MASSVASGVAGGLLGAWINRTPAAAPTTVDLGCMLYEPITWSEKDTPETIVGVKQHNAVWARLCHKANK